MHSKRRPASGTVRIIQFSDYDPVVSQIVSILQETSFQFRQSLLHQLRHQLQSSLREDPHGTSSLLRADPGDRTTREA